ncbi:hypothetical protein HOO68_02975 [Candidatus Gracilibacteria bacterium]|nr:hypothetical protein [Candidatus Gracilibacteria bacterium]
MKEILGAPTYSLGEAMRQPPSIPSYIFGPEMQEWLKKEGAISGIEYSQEGFWKGNIGSIKNLLNSIVDQIQGNMILYGANKIDTISSESIDGI